MTENEVEILTLLMPKKGSEPLAKSLREIGGSRGSTHSVTAARMDAKGWITRHNLGKGSFRPSYVFKITEAGMRALANHRASQTLA